MILKFTNNLSKIQYQYEVEDKGTSGIFFDFNIRLDDGMEDGEYTYELIEFDKVIANGLCQVGDYKATTTQYNKKQNYKVYNG